MVAFVPAPNPETLRRALEAATAAARDAETVLRGYARDLSRLALRDKGTNELVSQADVDAQRALVARLGGVVPGATFLGEEEALGETETEAGLRWILDPLDGTTNFTRGVSPHAVSVGLVDGTTPLVGVVLELGLGELFTAIRGEGARLNGEPIRVSDVDDLPDTLIATGFPYRSFHYQDAFLSVLGSLFGRSRGVRRHGAASVDLAYVACGRFDAYWETGISPWDVAAGLLLVEEAGGRATDFRGAPEPVYTGQVLATNGRVHDAMLDAVSPLRDVVG